MKNDRIAVLDLGSTKAACLVACLDDRGALKVDGYAAVPCKGVRRGIVHDLEETAKAIDNAARKVQQQVGEEIPSFVVGVAGSHLQGVNAQGIVPIYPRSRTITREDVLQVINHSRQMMLPPDREQIQALPREFRIDGERGIRRPIGMSGGRLEVVTYIVTGEMTHLQNIEKAVGMGGRKVEQMVLQPLASGLAVLNKEELELGAAVVDIGGGTTDIGVFVGGNIVFSASLPVGGNHVTSDLSKLLKVSPEEADRLKHTYGGSLGRLVSEQDTVEVLQIGQPGPRPMQRKVLCEIIESRMREIATMVRQQIEKSGMLGVLPGGLVLTGGGSRLEQTDALFADVLKHVHVRSLEPTLPNGGGRVTMNGSPLPGTVDFQTVGLATALGLAEYALGEDDDELGTADGATSWKQRIKVWRSMLVGR